MITPRQPDMDRTVKRSERTSEGLSRRWTQSEISQVRSSLASGAAMAEVARQVGRDIEEVRALAGQLRIKVG